MSQTLKDLLHEIADKDPERDGLPVSDITCTEAGRWIETRADLLQRLEELGLVDVGSHYIDITEEGLASCGVRKR